MEQLYIRQLSVDDGDDVYEMLQRIGGCENQFANTAHGLTKSEFARWLKEQDDWSHGVNLPEGYVPQTIFWLYDGDKPVGIGKIRHGLNEHSRVKGGNIGYAIDPQCRGAGYGTVIVGKLVEKASELGISEKLLTIEISNIASRRAVEKCGGTLVDENSERWFFRFE